MSRAKRGFKRRRRVNKVRDKAEGFVMGRRSQYGRMVEAVGRSLAYAYRDRRARKRDFRQLWIARINAAATTNDISYSRLMNALKNSSVNLDRKILADIAVQDPSGFTGIVDEVRSQAPAH